MRSLLSLLLTASLAAHLSACSTSEPGADSDLIGAGASLEAPLLQTRLDPSTMSAGETTVVTCSRDIGLGFEEDSSLTFSVDPSEGAAIDNGRIVVEVAGTYTVRCEDTELGVVDTEGATLTVTPADAERVVAEVDPPLVEVFETSVVTCMVFDRFSNLIEDVETSPLASEDLLVEGNLASSEKVGTYDVLCDLAGEGAGSLEQEAAELKVSAAAPAILELGVTPDLESYAVGQMVDLYWVVRDTYGNQILGLPVIVEIPEANIEVVDAEDHKYRLLEEGLYPFRVTLAEPHEAVTTQRTLVVDESGPEIVVTWPSRGETVLGEGDFLTIEGSVTDAFGAVTSFELDGVPVSVEEDGSFEAVVLPEWGVNLINAWAEDEFGNQSKLSPSYQYSSSYLDYQDKDLTDVIQEDGLELLIGQEFLDDGDHDLTKIDDLATIMEVILSELSISELLGGFGGFPVLNLPINVFNLNLGILEIGVGGDVQVNVAVVDPTDIGPVMVTIDSRLGGIDSGIEFGNAEEKGLQVALELTLDFNIGLTISSFLGAWNPNLSTQVVLDSEVSIDNLLLASKIDIQKVAGEELYVDLVQLDNEVVNLEIDPIEDVVLAFEVDLDVPLIPAFGLDFALSDLFDLTSLTDQILDPITKDFVPLIIEFTTPLIEQFADEILKQLLMALELQTSLPLPELLGPKPEPIELGLATALSRVDFIDEGGQIGLSMGLHTDSQVAPEPLGSIQRDGCLQGEEDIFFYGWDRSFGGAMKTDVVNAGLFATWRSGFLDGPIDLGGLLDGLGGVGSLPIPLDDLELQLTWSSAPVLNDCGGKGILQLEFGDLLAELDANILGSEISAVLYVDAAISLFFGSSAEGLSVTVGDFAFLEVEIIEYEETEAGLLDIRDLLENQLYGLLSGLIVGQSFGPLDLEPIALGDVVPGLPAEAVLDLGNLSITKEGGYVVLGADLL